jgi:hypothetical protein
VNCEPITANRNLTPVSFQADWAQTSFTNGLDLHPVIHGINLCPTRFQTGIQLPDYQSESTEKKERIILMTYNFDPDRWYENELIALKDRYKSGKINEQEHADAFDDLDRRHEEMWKRLDGSYRIPQGRN